jgi:two-component system, HptB-dependent secretion and biofilm response regulator
VPRCGTAYFRKHNYCPLSSAKAMRLNLPVTNIEHTLPDGVVIVSKTDTRGVITYCNRAFVEISGRSREEIIGSPHNIVRHPDMPSEVFADLWATIKANKPWQGVVKNRQSDGSFYWAISNVTPLQENGLTTGYVAFRYKATQEQIEQASNAYRELNEGGSRLRIEEGNIIRVTHSMLHWLSAASLKSRLFALIFLLLGALVASGIYNLYEFSQAHTRTMDGFAKASVHAYALETARSTEAVFSRQLHIWKEIMTEGHDPDRYHKFLLQLDQLGDEVDQKLEGQLKPIIQQFNMPTQAVDTLLASHQDLVRKWHEALKYFDVNRPETGLIINNLVRDDDHLVTAQFESVVADIRDMQLQGLADLNEAMEESYQAQRDRSALILVTFSLGGLLLSLWFIVGILRPVSRASKNLNRVSQLQQQFLEKILTLEEYQDRQDEEQRIGSYIMGNITKVHGTLDPLVRHLIRPAEFMSGDMLLAARTPDDELHILLADAVGHGLVAAVNVLPLSHAFYEMTAKGFRIAHIAAELNLLIHKFMPVDRFVSAVLISVNSRNRVIEVWNGGIPALQLLSRNGELLRQWESIHLPLGILSGENFTGKPENYQYEDDCQLCLYSDGLPEAESLQGIGIGRERIVKLLQDNPPGQRFDALVAALDSHLAGKSAHDDVSLAMIEVHTLQCMDTVFHASTPAIHVDGSNWKIEISLGAAELKYLNIVPMLTNIIEKIHIANEFAAPLFMILSELFNNALDHGILRLDSNIKHGIDGFDKFLQLREERLLALESGKIDLLLENVLIEGKYGVKIRVIDSGAGFNYASIATNVGNQPKSTQHGRGITLVESMAYQLEYAGNGNDVTAYYICA